jgi:hypothetical protein
MLENEKKPDPAKDGLSAVIERAEAMCRDSATGPMMLSEVMRVLGKTGIYDSAISSEFANLLKEIADFNTVMASKIRALAIKVAAK